MVFLVTEFALKSVQKCRFYMETHGVGLLYTVLDTYIYHFNFMRKRKLFEKKKTSN